MRTYKIRQFQNGRNKTTGEAYINYSLTIPSEIATKLPPDLQFACSIDDEGLHFRPVEETAEPQEMPTWAKANANGKPKRERKKPGETAATSA